MWKLRRMGGISADQAAETAIYLATDPEAGKRSGLYWDQCKPKPSSARSMNKEDAERLWKLSSELCGIDRYFS